MNQDEEEEEEEEKNWTIKKGKSKSRVVSSGEC